MHPGTKLSGSCSPRPQQDCTAQAAPLVLFSETHCNDQEGVARAPLGPWEPSSYPPAYSSDGLSTPLIPQASPRPVSMESGLPVFTGLSNLVSGRLFKNDEHGNITVGGFGGRLTILSCMAGGGAQVRRQWGLWTPVC